jgi:hypothetical protein
MSLRTASARRRFGGVLNQTLRITGCAALNASIIAVKGSDIHRVAGTVNGALGRNIARAGLVPKILDGTHGG